MVSTNDWKQYRPPIIPNKETGCFEESMQMTWSFNSKKSMKEIHCFLTWNWYDDVVLNLFITSRMCISICHVLRLCENIENMQFNIECFEIIGKPKLYTVIDVCLHWRIIVEKKWLEHDIQVPTFLTVEANYNAWRFLGMFNKVTTSLSVGK